MQTHQTSLPIIAPPRSQVLQAIAQDDAVIFLQGPAIVVSFTRSLDWLGEPIWKALIQEQSGRGGQWLRELYEALDEGDALEEGCEIYRTTYDSINFRFTDTYDETVIRLSSCSLPQWARQSKRYYLRGDDESHDHKEIGFREHELPHVISTLNALNELACRQLGRPWGPVGRDPPGTRQFARGDETPWVSKMGDGDYPQFLSWARPIKPTPIGWNMPKWFDPMTIPIRKRPVGSGMGHWEPSTSMLASQKARGIVQLGKKWLFGNVGINHSLSGLDFNAVGSVRIWPHAWPKGWMPDPQGDLDVRQPVTFARPCPARPRHGFIDSVPVRTERELYDLVEKVEASDEPEAEILFMPLIDAAWSSIVTAAGVALGPGHDGATEGRESISVPAPSDVGAFNRYVLSCGPGVSGTPDHYGLDDQWAYIETVTSRASGKINPVQVRAGPPLSLGKLYVPNRMTVQEVVRAEGDLMEWERRAKAFVGKPGLVVWQPGGNMASHYAAHCTSHGIAFSCKEEAPNVGDVLEVEKPEALTPADHIEMANEIPGVYTWLRTTMLEYEGDENNIKYSHTARICAASAAILHASPSWGREEHLRRLRVAGAVATFQLAAAACFGEGRHWKSSGPGRLRDDDGHRMFEADSPEWVTASLDGSMKSRRTVHSKSLEKGPRELLPALADLVGDFSKSGWKAGMGGTAWRRCAKVTLRLGRSLARYMQAPNAATWASIIRDWNLILNTSHNNGGLLTKYLPQAVFDVASHAPSAVLGLLSGNTIWAASRMELPWPGGDTTRREWSAGLRDVSARMSREDMMPDTWDGPDYTHGSQPHLWQYMLWLEHQRPSGQVMYDNVEQAAAEDDDEDEDEGDGDCYCGGCGCHSCFEDGQCNDHNCADCYPNLEAICPDGSPFACAYCTDWYSDHPKCVRCDDRFDEDEVYVGTCIDDVCYGALCDVCHHILTEEAKEREAERAELEDDSDTDEDDDDDLVDSEGSDPLTAPATTPRITIKAEGAYEIV